MKLFNRFSLLVVVVSICSASLFYAIDEPVKAVGVSRKEPVKKAIRVKAFNTAQDAKQAITSAHTSVYSQDNLLISVGLDSSTEYREKKALWDSLLRELHNYIKKTDSSLMSDYLVVSNVSSSFLDLMANVYNNDIVGFIKKEKQEAGISKFDVNQTSDLLAQVDLIALSNKLPSIEQKIRAFDVNVKKIMDVDRRLKDKLTQYRKSFFTSAKKGDAVEVIRFLIEFVSTQIEKYTRDFNRIKIVCNKAKKTKETTLQRRQEELGLFDEEVSLVKKQRGEAEPLAARRKVMAIEARTKDEDREFAAGIERLKVLTSAKETLPEARKFYKTLQLRWHPDKLPQRAEKDEFFGYPGTNERYTQYTKKLVDVKP